MTGFRLNLTLEQLKTLAQALYASGNEGLAYDPELLGHLNALIRYHEPTYDESPVWHALSPVAPWGDFGAAVRALEAGQV